MIDTHCHLLPGLDDGPGSDIEAIELARQLVREGVTFVLCTPHFSRACPTSADRAAAAQVRLKDQLDALEIPLPTGLAAEVHTGLLDDAVHSPEGRAIDGRWLIVELTEGTELGEIDRALALLSTRGLTPVFAHPERCRAVRREPAPLTEARGAGALVQLVAPTLAGNWGAEVEGAAWSLLDAGQVDLVGSDSHRASARGTLGTALDRIRARYGQETVRELTEAAPRRLLGFDRAESVREVGGTAPGA